MEEQLCMPCFCSFFLFLFYERLSLVSKLYSQYLGGKEVEMFSKWLDTLPTVWVRSIEIIKL